MPCCLGECSFEVTYQVPDWTPNQRSAEFGYSVECETSADPLLIAQKLHRPIQFIWKDVHA